ncbi:MAG: response regulator [bacterium]|nr:response regulator [bacterium]
MEEKTNVLIVEDDKGLGEFLSTCLKEKGFSVEIVEDGGSALSHIEKRPPDLILLDIMIPVVDGFEVCCKLKQQEKFQNIPIIIITARSDQDSMMAGFESGVDDYLVKPLDTYELILKIEKALKVKELIDGLRKNLVNMSSEICPSISAIKKEAELLLKGKYGNLSKEQVQAIKNILKQISLYKKSSDFVSAQQHTHRMKSAIKRVKHKTQNL